MPTFNQIRKKLEGNTKKEAEERIKAFTEELKLLMEKYQVAMLVNKPQISITDIKPQLEEAENNAKKSKV